MEHDSEKSLPYNDIKGCPEHYHRRKGYTTKKGTHVLPRCIRSTTIYPETSAEYRANVTAKRRKALHGVKDSLGLSRKCPKGYMLKAPYKRSYSTTLKQQGYNVHKKNITYRAYPKAGSTLIKATCIKDKGLPGKGPNLIGPLRKGELSRYGYNLHKTENERHEALRTAIGVYGALGVYKKLDAVAKLTVRTVPEASLAFKKDRDWVKKTYSLKGSA